MTNRRTRCVLAATAILAGLTLAAPAAEAVPSVTFKCTPAPQDCSGWFRADVKIDWTVLPTDAHGAGRLRRTRRTPPTRPGGTNEFCSADDGTAVDHRRSSRSGATQRRRSSRAARPPAPPTPTAGTTATSC